MDEISPSGVLNRIDLEDSYGHLMAFLQAAKRIP